MNAYDPLAALAAFEASCVTATRDPASSLALARWQREFLADTSRRRLIRGANRIGKTLALAADIVHDVRGTNPYRPRIAAGPLNCLFVGESIEQLSREGGPIETIWNLIPRHEVDSDIVFERGRGLRGAKYPAIPFVNGPGAGSVIRFGTYAQGAAVYAGFKAHRVDCDEPTPEPIYAELAPRVFSTGGTFTISFTPVLGMPEQTWLRKLVADKVFHEHHVTLTEEALWLEGYARPRHTQAEIDDLVSSWPEIERGLRARAEWDAVVLDRYLSSFTPGHNVHAMRPPAGAYVVVGIDHGLKPGKQAAVLMAITDRENRDACRVWFLDETPETDGTNTPLDDAASILAMLERNGLSYDDVDAWVGDRQTGDGLILKSKSNGDLKKAFARKLGRVVDGVKWIATPYKYDGSVAHGLFLLNALFKDRRALVHPRCVRFSTACDKFRGHKDDPHKDVLDAGRYAVEHAVGRLRGGSAPIHLSKWS